jgi:sterol desaturase/sphingolipid hydroxylase (fatty acid hydroxylase superfamily)
MIEAVQTILWSALVVAALYPLEMLFAAEDSQDFSKRLKNFAYMPLIISFAYLIQPAVNYAASGIIRTNPLPSGGLLPDFVFGNVVLSSLLFALIWDTWQYWVHRLQHSSRFFWATHEFHHSETALNATTHSRTHLLSHLMYIAFYLPILLLIGNLAPHWIVALLIFRFWGYFNHANLRLRLGPLTPVISGPQFHRIHHSVEPEHQNKNFAALFPVLDIIFGTYHAPKPDEYPATGLAEGKSVDFVRDATIEPVFIMRRALAGRRWLPWRSAPPEAMSDRPKS